VRVHVPSTKQPLQSIETFTGYMLIRWLNLFVTTYQQCVTLSLVYVGVDLVGCSSRRQASKLKQTHPSGQVMRCWSKCPCNALLGLTNC